VLESKWPEAQHCWLGPAAEVAYVAHAGRRSRVCASGGHHTLGSRGGVAPAVARPVRGGKVWRGGTGVEWWRRWTWIGGSRASMEWRCGGVQQRSTSGGGRQWLRWAPTALRTRGGHEVRINQSFGGQRIELTGRGRQWR
jgi:hypothetical protein